MTESAPHPESKTPSTQPAVALNPIEQAPALLEAFDAGTATPEQLETLNSIAGRIAKKRLLRGGRFDLETNSIVGQVESEFDVLMTEKNDQGKRESKLVDADLAGRIRSYAEARSNQQSNPVEPVVHTIHTMDGLTPAIKTVSSDTTPSSESGRSRRGTRRASSQGSSSAKTNETSSAASGIQTNGQASGDPEAAAQTTAASSRQSTSANRPQRGGKGGKSGKGGAKSSQGASESKPSVDSNAGNTSATAAQPAPTPAVPTTPGRTRRSASRPQGAPARTEAGDPSASSSSGTSPEASSGKPTGNTSAEHGTAQTAPERHLKVVPNSSGPSNEFGPTTTYEPRKAGLDALTDQQQERAAYQFRELIDVFPAGTGITTGELKRILEIDEETGEAPELQRLLGVGRMDVNLTDRQLDEILAGFEEEGALVPDPNNRDSKKVIYVIPRENPKLVKVPVDPVVARRNAEIREKYEKDKAEVRKRVLSRKELHYKRPHKNIVRRRLGQLTRINHRLTREDYKEVIEEIVEDRMHGWNVADHGAEGQDFFAEPDIPVAPSAFDPGAVVITGRGIGFVRTRSGEAEQMTNEWIAKKAKAGVSRIKSHVSKRIEANKLARENAPESTSFDPGAVVITGPGVGFVRTRDGKVEQMANDWVINKTKAGAKRVAAKATELNEARKNRRGGGGKGGPGNGLSARLEAAANTDPGDDDGDTNSDTVTMRAAGQVKSRTERLRAASRRRAATRAQRANERNRYSRFIGEDGIFRNIEDDNTTLA